ncbi:hypothetical protein TNCV_115491 [Trichonephila clavipes]|nr:hypothetical protein TNCV_115491 [Trichonephila clavipes]
MRSAEKYPPYIRTCCTPAVAGFVTRLECLLPCGGGHVEHILVENTLGWSEASHLSSPSTNHTRGLVARRLFTVPPCREGTYTFTNIHVFSGIRTQDQRLSVANHYTGWVTYAYCKWSRDGTASSRLGIGRPRGTTEREDHRIQRTTVRLQTTYFRSEWKSVILCDERKFCLGSRDGRVLVSRRTGCHSMTTPASSKVNTDRPSTSTTSMELHTTKGHSEHV